VFKIVKIQRTDLVTYLLEDYRGKFMAGAFYELHRATHPDIHTSWEKYCAGEETRFT